MKNIIKAAFALTAFASAATFGSVYGVRANASNGDEVEATKSVRVEDNEYKLVTSTKELELGKKVIIASPKWSYAMSTTQNSRNRSETSLTKKTSNGLSYAIPSSSVAKFTLIEGYYSGSYAFYDEQRGGVLYSSSNSYLTTSSYLSSYSSFVIGVSNNGTATVRLANAYRYIRYDYYNYAFSAFSSGKYDICLYQEVSEEEVVEDIPSTISVTGVALDKTSASLEVGKSLTLSATVSPSNATNKEVTWTSSNTSVATVSNGKVTALNAGNSTITVKTADGSYKATCKVTVTNPVEEEEPTPVVTDKSAWTIMIYMCGADLESQSGLATSDIKEILSVSGQPKDVNILIQTGGAKSWKSTYGIKSTYLQRYHVSNKSLVLENNISKSSMGQASTFESFLEWGLTSYPAEKTGVIMWNHGGAMTGVCFDENFSDDSLLNSEVNTAVAKAFANTGRTEKLEFIGYDACLMNVQDIAEFNSHYFNYMVASEETESGYGWDYDTWVDDLYAKKSTSTILKAVVDGFIKENGGTSSSSNDQTLSYLNLSKMAAYKTAWENMASQLSKKITSSNKTSFRNLVKKCKYYGDNYYVYYGIFDAKDFVNKVASNTTFNPGSTYTNAVLTAYSDVVEYSSCGKGAGNSNGMAMFFSISSSCAKSTYYTSNETSFTNWRNLVNTVGA